MGHMLHLHRGVVHLPSLAAEHGRRVVYAAFVFFAGGIAIAFITALAWWSGHPLVVPSLGPTAFLIFNRAQSVAARPRNALLGHLIGAVSGLAALWAFGLSHAPSVVQGGITPSRIGAAGLSIALTSAVMILVGVEHGPAGATTLIVSLGFMTTPASVGLLMAGVVILVVCGVAIDRAAGLQLPYWSGQHHAAPPAGRRVQASFPGGDGAIALHHNGTHAATGSGVRRRTAADRRWVVDAGEGRRVSVGPEECRVKVDSAATGGSYALVEVTLDPDRPATVLHVHYGFAETYVVTEGEVVAEIGVDRVHAGRGSVICIPKGVAHLLSCARHQPVRLLCVTEQAVQSEPEFLP